MLHEEIFLKENIMRPDFNFGINSRCAAIVKISNDARSWD
jgi:hypothetical protein